MLWNFKELLSWKVSDHLLSTSSRESQERLAAKQEADGYICSYASNAQLYQLDLITQRVKEQKVNFVGIITHVKQFADKGGSNKESSYKTLVTTHIDLESTDDKSKVALFVKHSS